MRRSVDLGASRLCQFNALHPGQFPGLFPEQIDPGSGLFLGNYPQALSHIGLIATSTNFTRLLRQEFAEQ